MIDLPERLSEFSYGYGVTREVESLLASVSMRTAPFMPSLLHEAKLGFDVAFKNPGSVLRSERARDIPSHFEPRAHPDMQAERVSRLLALRSRARSEEDAIAAAVGIEAWSLGIQLILVTPNGAPGG
jgi:hypothetical protein